MEYTFIPKGVCSRKISIEIDNGIITNCKFTGGCSGNTQGLCSLIIGMDAEEAMNRLRGIDCNGRGTSCPDQLSIAIEEALELE